MGEHPSKRLFTTSSIRPFNDWTEARSCPQARKPNTQPAKGVAYILIVNLAKGRLGPDSANILGSIMVATIGMAALSRAEDSADTRRPFYVHVDEFQNFTTLAFVTMLPELRKMGIGLVLANQHLHQLHPDVLHAVLGNSGTLIAFRVGVEDAPMIAREMQPKIAEIDLINLPNWHFYTRLMIGGLPSKPFSANIRLPDTV